MRGLEVVPVLATLVFQQPASKSEALKPVKFTVVDRVTKKPLNEFSYSLSITVPGEVHERHEAKEPARVDVKSATGTFVVPAPASCRLELDIDSRDTVAGYQHNLINSFALQSSDPKREFVIQVEVGITVRGIVRDSAEKKPLAGATVAPIIDMHQARGPNLERAVKTDADGRFEVHGVNPQWGAVVKHPSHKSHFIACGGPEVLRGDPLLIDLKVGEAQTIRGIIRDDDSRGVQGAEISGWGVTTTSGPDGRFTLVIPPPDYTHGEVHFKKAGYARKGFESVQLPMTEELAVQMVPLFDVNGTVLSSTGEPVSSFTMAVGPKLDSEYGECIAQQVQDPAGQFSVLAKEAGLNRVLVKADRHAVWKGTISVARKGVLQKIKLQPGVTVSGRVARPAGSRAPLAARLIPNPVRGMENIYDETGRGLATLKSHIADDGTYVFEHVRPDGYQLCVEGEDITPVYRLVEVEHRSLDIGELQPAGTGRIVGTIHLAGGLNETAWPFAAVFLESAGRRVTRESVTGEERAATADENGQFTLEHVPEGVHGILARGVNLDSYAAPFMWGARVVAGKTTEVHTFDRGKDRRLELSIVVGNGSRRDFENGSAERKQEHTLLSFLNPEPSFTLALMPRVNEACAFSMETNPGNRSDRARIRLNDVSPGAYHLSLTDAPEYVGAIGSVLYEHEVLFRPGAPPVEISLGAASIECTVERGWHGSVLAIEQGSELPARLVHYSEDRPFAIRFVRPGTYTLIAHDEKNGWGKAPRFQVGNGIAKAAPIKLVAGGSVQGRVIARVACLVPDAVVAVDSTGIEIADSKFGQSELMEYRIPHLWPGEWTIKLLAEENEVASTRVKISGIEAVTSDLVVSEPSPHHHDGDRPAIGGRR